MFIIIISVYPYQVLMIFKHIYRLEMQDGESFIEYTFSFSHKVYSSILMFNVHKYGNYWFNIINGLRDRYKYYKKKYTLVSA